MHFLHDLESLYWTYLWFVHNRVPVGSAASDEIKRGRAECFFSPTVGKAGRVGLITDSLSYVDILEYLEPLYPARTALLSPVSFSAEITQEYERIQQVEPEQKDGIWQLPIHYFTEDLYDNFLTSLQTARQILQSDGEPVEPVSLPGQHISGQITSMRKPDSNVV